MTPTPDYTHLRELAYAASPGPWSTKPADSGHFALVMMGSLWLAKCPAQYDADLIAAMRNALPSLLARIEELEFECATTKAALVQATAELRSQP